MTESHPPSEDGSWHHEIGTPSFPAAPSRYHLYIGTFCPYAHRADLARSLKGLQPFLPTSIVKPYPKEPGGWRFPSTSSEHPGSTPDHIHHSTFLSELYFKSFQEYKGKYTVPMLWDKESKQVVNNESQDIMRMLNNCFNDLLPRDNIKQRELDLYPPDLQPQIDELSSWMSPDLTMSVYKAGFAPTPSAYASAAKTVFLALERFETHLSQHNKYIYLLSPDRITEIDLKLYTTLIRFNPAYHPQFTFSNDEELGNMRDRAPRVNRWLKHLYWKVEGARETTDFRAIAESFCGERVGIKGPEEYLEPWTEEDEMWRVKRARE
ncbi:MAG: hypothetical protein Q9218_004527 [Villophora microphyllina]